MILGLDRTMKIIHAAAVVLVDTDGRVLISSRPDYKTVMPGYWEFPGGKLEEGETPEEALRREIDEELGIKLGCFTPLSFISEPRGKYHVIVYVYICREWNGIPCPMESQGMKWVRVNELSQWDILPANKPLIPLIRDTVTEI